MLLIVATSGLATAVFHPGEYVAVHRGRTIQSVKEGLVRVACPSGDRVVSGGAYWHRQGQNGDPTLNAVIVSSSPSTDTLGWFAVGANQDNEPLVFTVEAQCLPRGSIGKYHVFTADRTVAAHTTVEAQPLCPSGEVVVTGGAAWHRTGHAPASGLSAELTTSVRWESWDAAGYNTGSSPLHLLVTSLCRPLAAVGSAVLESDTRTLAYGASAEIYLACASGYRIVGGGVYWTQSGSEVKDGQVRAAILSSTPTGDGTSWYGSGVQRDSRYLELVLNVFAYCYPA